MQEPLKMVGMVEIADLLGVNRQLVANWRVRYPDFPVPDLQLAAGPLWILEKVDSWGRQKNMVGDIICRNPEQIGKHFTNEAICNFHRCEQVPYLRKVGGRIVCGCFNLTLNPNAPCKILVENTRKRVARANEIVQQKTAIPCYSKISTDVWRYEGLFLPISYITEKSLVLPLSEKAGRENVAGLLTFEQVKY